MRRSFIFIIVVFFGFVSVVMAQQDAANDSDVLSEDVSEPLLIESPMGSDFYPVVRETVEILKEIRHRIQVYKFAEQNPDLMQKVDDVIEMDEEALSEFDALMQFSDPDQPLAAPPVSFDMYTVAREGVDTLKELLDKLQGCKFVEENLDLIERAEDLLKREI